MKLHRHITLILALLHIIIAAASAETVDHGFKLSDTPEIKNRQDITLVAEKGFWTEHLRTILLPRFTKKTGIKVRLIALTLDEMYSVQTESLKNGKGNFDLLTLEAGWAKEWAANGYTVPLLQLAKEYDVAGEDGMTRFLDAYYSSLLQILGYKGQYHSIPYNNYVMGNHYRRDLFEHPQERSSFSKRYGYSLAPPKTLQNLLDVAEFFTRKKGQQLAGKELTRDFYGVTLMSGNRPHINDEFSTMLWGLGGAWLRPIRDKKNTLKYFKVEADNQIAVEAARTYLQLLEYAIPAHHQWAFMESAGAFANGQVAMWPFAYNNLWAVSSKIEKNIPNARIGIAQVPLGKPYNGAYAIAVSYDSKNSEAAYWLLKFIGSYEGQMAYALGGGNPCRIDVVTDNRFNSKENHLLSGAFSQSHEANLSWANKVLDIGHFTSTAMGKIYPELMNTSYRIRSRSEEPEVALTKLKKTILDLQNRYGENAAIE